MSNVIKASSVCYDTADTKLIDGHLRFEYNQALFIQAQKALVQRAQAQKVIGLSNETEPSNVDEFVIGLNAPVVEKFDVEESLILREMSSKIIDDSRNEANIILNQAKEEAQQIKKDAFTTAKQSGYLEGYSEGEKEILKIKDEFEEKKRILEEEYDLQLNTLEPQFVQIISSLIEKVTGIMVEGKEEVILHLIHKAILNIDKCNQYTIKVAKDDYEYLISKKNVLLNVIPKDAQLVILEDSGLTKNQCLIETDLRVIDCSLDVQLSNLITDLRLLGGI